MGQNCSCPRMSTSMRSDLLYIPLLLWFFWGGFSRFLDEVQAHSSINKMSVQNLATVFGPNILRPKMEDPVTMMEGRYSCCWGNTASVFWGCRNMLKVIQPLVVVSLVDCCTVNNKSSDPFYWCPWVDVPVWLLLSHLPLVWECLSSPLHGDASALLQVVVWNLLLKWKVKYSSEGPC